MNARSSFCRSTLRTQAASLALLSVVVLAAVAQDLIAEPVKRLAHFPVQPEKPNTLEFSPVPARFIRFAIEESDGGQPCLDELEVYGVDGKTNLASATRGAKASASSCLSGYAIHQVAHLNDGLYGNSHSWIAAGSSREWAQIELPSTEIVASVVFSRDREGRYRDRLPAQLEIQLSGDGQAWKTVCRVGTRICFPTTSDWGALLNYAFLCEHDTWSRIDADPPVLRVLKQIEPMLERIGAKGIDVSTERKEVAALRLQQAESSQGSVGDQEDAEAAYLRARLTKRRLFLRDPDLAPLQRILFVGRHPYEPSHNYSDILDAQWRPGGGVCSIEIPRPEGRLDPSSAKATSLFDASRGVARDAVPSFDANRIFFAYRDSAEGYFQLRAVNADGTGLQRLTDAPFHDYFPCPLPDGGLAFVSTRCKARFLCWRPQAFVLFRMDGDGGNIRPLSFANLSEWAPSVMRDGRILWTRSEYLDKGADFGHTLWAIRQDGTHPQLIFGNNTLNCYMNAREVPGTDELCCTLISHGGDLNGPIALINPIRGRFNPAAITNITPDSTPRYHMDWAQRECFRDPVPIARDFFLVSHAPQSHFGIYVIDRFGCIGCHEHRATTAAVRQTVASTREPRRLEAPSWGAAPFCYQEVVQPVWDAQCVRCHDATDKQKLDLTGSVGPDRVPSSYRTLITQGWVHYFDYAWGQEHKKAEPLSFGTVQSRLWRVLDAGHYDVKLTRDEMHRVKCWIDLNCPLWPDYIPSFRMRTRSREKCLKRPD